MIRAALSMLPPPKTGSLRALVAIDDIMMRILAFKMLQRSDIRVATYVLQKSLHAALMAPIEGTAYASRQP